MKAVIILLVICTACQLFTSLVFTKVLIYQGNEIMKNQEVIYNEMKQIGDLI